jgi:UDP:flavonoid glycosyltransferase YjiC (YdhE family)
MAFKVFIFTVPAIGHMNPILVIAKRLIEEYKLHCIWYSVLDFKDIIENIGAEFRIINADKEYLEHRTNSINKRTSELIGLFTTLLQAMAFKVSKILRTSSQICFFLMEWLTTQNVL